MSEGVSIGIVEDTKAMATMLRIMLEGQGHTISWDMPDGTNLLEKYKASPPTILLIDDMLPGISGLELYHLIREQSIDQKIIYKTLNDIVPPELLTEANVAIMHEPFTQAKLGEVISKLLGEA